MYNRHVCFLSKEEYFVSSVSIQVHTKPVKSVKEKGVTPSLILTLHLQLQNFIFQYSRSAVVSIIRFH